MNARPARFVAQSNSAALFLALDAAMSAQFAWLQHSTTFIMGGIKERLSPRVKELNQLIGTSHPQCSFQAPNVRCRFFTSLTVCSCEECRRYLGFSMECEFCSCQCTWNSSRSLLNVRLRPTPISTETPQRLCRPTEAHNQMAELPVTGELQIVLRRASKIAFHRAV